MNSARLNAVGLCILLVLLPGVSGCMNEGPPLKHMQIKTNVEGWKIVTSPMVDYVTLPGVVEPVSAVTISGEISGKVKLLPVKEGDEVRKGQVLLAIDKEELELMGQQAVARVTELEAQLKNIKSGARDEEIAQLKAAVESALSARDLAADQEQRRKKLFEDGILAKEMYDAASTALTAAEKRLEQSQEALKLARKGATQETIQSSEARLASAKAALELAKRTYEKAEITSPIDGVIDEKYIEEGELVAPGKKLFRIVTVDKVKVVVWASERVVTKVQTGDPVSLEFDMVEESVQAVISRIGFAADQATRTFKIEVLLDNPKVDDTDGSADRVYRIGYIASVKITVDEIPRAVKIPIDALVLRGARLIVYTFEKANPGNPGPESEPSFKAKAHDVEIGLKNSDSIQITSGIEAGDMLVVKGQRWLKGGEEVNVVKTHEGGWPW